MAVASRGGVTLKVDERSIRSFKRNIDAVISATGEYAKEELMDFCEDVLSDANEMIPIDTGTAAESAGYKVEKVGEGYKARMGYAIFKDPVNPRTGKKASSYIAEIHENYHFTTPKNGMAKANGQGKFFEKALWLHVGDFYRKTEEALRDILAAPALAARRKPREFSSPEAKERYLNYQARLHSGFTARHGGKILPYPLNSGKKVPTGRKSTKKTAQSVRGKVRSQFSRDKYRSHNGYQSMAAKGQRGSYASAARLNAKSKAKYSKHHEDLMEDFKAAYATHLKNSKKKK